MALEVCFRQGIFKLFNQFKANRNLGIDDRIDGQFRPFGHPGQGG